MKINTNENSPPEDKKEIKDTPARKSQCKDYSKVDDTYRLLTDQRLGGGSFGYVYKCLNTKTSKEYSAKVESSDTTKPQLLHEYKILEQLKGAKGIPQPFLFKNRGTESIMVLDLLGPNLEDILQDTKTKKFSLKTCLMTFKQVVERLNIIHREGIIHRDLKPENLLVTLNIREGLIYLIDFGLSKKFIDIKTEEHMPFKTERPITGTVRYISVNTHLGYEQSRRDDLESSLYVIMYFLNGELPWDGIKCKSKEEKIEKIGERKKEFKKNEEFSNLPQCFIPIFQYIYNLEYDERPNYSYITENINKGLEQFSGENNYERNLLDWQSIEFMIEPIFMILEMKQKKMAEKEKKKIEEMEKELKEKENAEDKKDEVKHGDNGNNNNEKGKEKGGNSNKGKNRSEGSKKNIRKKGKK